MASVASQLIEKVIARAQSDSLVDAREICADGTYFPINLRMYNVISWRAVALEKQQRVLGVLLIYSHCQQYKILIVALYKSFYGKLISPATLKRTEIFM